MNKTAIFLVEEKDRSRNEYSSAVIWWYGILEEFGFGVEYYDYKKFNFDKFYNHVKDTKPDYVFHSCYEQLHTEFFKLREYTKLYVIQSDDDWRFNQYAKYWIPVVDGTISFCGDTNTMKKLYNDLGCNYKSFIKSYWAFNPKTMIPQHFTTENEYKNRQPFISHVGSIYGNREKKIQQLLNAGIDIKVFQNQYYTEFQETLYASKASLCFTESSDLSINQLKGRLFEIPYFCPLLTEPFPEMNKYYEIGKDIIVFNSINELIDILKSNINWNQIYQNGRERLKEHYANNVWEKTILPYL